jgi:hypothetical protein
MRVEIYGKPSDDFGDSLAENVQKTCSERYAT